MNAKITANKMPRIIDNIIEQNMFIVSFSMFSLLYGLLFNFCPQLGQNIAPIGIFVLQYGHVIFILFILIPF